LKEEAKSITENPRHPALRRRRVKGGGASDQICPARIDRRAPPEIDGFLRALDTKGSGEEEESGEEKSLIRPRD